MPASVATALDQTVECGCQEFCARGGGNPVGFLQASLPECRAADHESDRLTTAEHARTRTHSA